MQTQRMIDGLPARELDEGASKSRPRLNFAGQDYLALGHHPAVRAAALSALGRHRQPESLHSPGLSEAVLDLEARVAEFVRLPSAVAFSSGSEAIRATLGSLLCAEDDVIVDAGAHPAMFETVRAVRARLHCSPAGSVEAVERRLRRLAAQPRRGRLYLAAPAISAHGSTMAAIAELSALARLHGRGADHRRESRPWLDGSGGWRCNGDSRLPWPCRYGPGQFREKLWCDRWLRGLPGSSIEDHAP